MRPLPPPLIKGRMTPAKLIPKSMRTLPASTIKTPMPKVEPPKPSDPGPPPDVSDGKAYHAWCMRVRAWKSYLSSQGTESQGQSFNRECMIRARQKVVIATLKWIADYPDLEDLKDKVENDLDALLEDEGLKSIYQIDG